MDQRKPQQVEAKKRPQMPGKGLALFLLAVVLSVVAYYLISLWFAAHRDDFMSLPVGWFEFWFDFTFYVAPGLAGAPALLFAPLKIPQKILLVVLYVPLASTTLLFGSVILACAGATSCL